MYMYVYTSIYIYTRTLYTHGIKMYNVRTLVNTGSIGYIKMKPFIVSLSWFMLPKGGTCIWCTYVA